MLLKVDPSLAFDWQQIVSKPNCVGHNFQLGKRVRERYLSSLPDRPSEDNFNPKKKKKKKKKEVTLVAGSPKFIFRR